VLCLDGQIATPLRSETECLRRLVGFQIQLRCQKTASCRCLLIIGGHAKPLFVAMWHLSAPSISRQGSPIYRQPFSRQDFAFYRTYSFIRCFENTEVCRSRSDGSSRRCLCIYTTWMPPMTVTRLVSKRGGVIPTA
jgi:hypothetical protein